MDPPLGSGGWTPTQLRVHTQGGIEQWSRRWVAADGRSRGGPFLARLSAQLQWSRDFAQAAPTPEHFLPLLYVAGLAAAARRPAKVLVDGYTYGSLSMTSYTLDVDCPRDGDDARPAAILPHPNTTPPDGTISRAASMGMRP